MNASSESTTLPELFSLEAEQSVIGAVIIHQESYYTVLEDVGLAADHFWAAAHRAIFTAFGQLIQRGQAIDVVTLSEHLENDGRLDAVGGIAYLAEVAENTPSSSNAANYARIVIERHQRRRLLEIGKELQHSALNPEGREVADLVQEAESRVLDIAANADVTRETQSSDRLFSEAQARLEQRIENGGKLIGLTTGFKQLDEMTSGLKNGNLVIVSGRPSSGKTAFALTLATNALIESERPILIFSLEMGSDELVDRQLSLVSSVSHSAIASGSVDGQEKARVFRASQAMQLLPLAINDRGEHTPSSIRSAARRTRREYGDLALIVVDYIQLMTGDGKYERRDLEISQITRSLKRLAKEMDCPVLALSQLSRKVEDRPNKRPINSDLRESGSVEQDSDVIIHIYRDEMYNEDSADAGIAEIIIGKQRNGPTGTVRLAFEAELTRFSDLT